MHRLREGEGTFSAFYRKSGTLGISIYAEASSKFKIKPDTIPFSKLLAFYLVPFPGNRKPFNFAKKGLEVKESIEDKFFPEMRVSKPPPNHPSVSASPSSISVNSNQMGPTANLLRNYFSFLSSSLADGVFNLAPPQKRGEGRKGKTLFRPSFFSCLAFDPQTIYPSISFFPPSPQH